jgi:hypothetical protein
MIRVVDAEASETRQDQALVETADPRTILAQAQRWRERGTPFPDALLRKAVEAALQPEASWDDITAAITAFDVYQDRPWVTQVMQPFVVYNATNILLNADMLARMHHTWAQRAVEMAAPQAPASCSVPSGPWSPWIRSGPSNWPQRWQRRRQRSSGRM